MVIAAIRRYILNVLVALDQMGSALLGGDPDETLSSRLGKAIRGDFGRFQKVLWMPAALLVDIVFMPFDGPGHCLRMIEEDEGGSAVDWESGRW